MGVPKDIYNQQKEKWIDIDSEWNIDGNGNIKRVFNAEAVKASIQEILATHRGERVMRRDFGSGLTGRLFEAVTHDDASNAADIVKDAIESNDDRVTVVNVDFEIFPDKNVIELIVIYILNDFGQEFEYRALLGE